MGQRLGGIVYQVNEAFKEIRSFGQSKHSAKEAFKSSFVGSKAINNFMPAFSKEVGIFSDQTYKDYLSVACQLANFVKTEYSIKDISKLSAEHIKSFLESKADLSRATIQKYSSAIEKFETALSAKYNKTYNFEVKSALPSSVKENLKVVERSGYSGYKYPSALVSHIQNMPVKAEFKLAAQLQLESGVRGLKDINNIRINGDKIDCATKGGKIRELKLSAELKSDLKSYIQDNGLKTFKVEYKEYLTVLKSAALATNQKYEGTHGLRHNFYDNKALELQRDGLSVKDSWKETSAEIGHNRIVGNYTR